jgi:Family of unknown function (DUF5317)
VTILAALLGIIAGYVAGGHHGHLVSRRVRMAGLPVIWAALVVVTMRDWVPGAFALFVASFGVALVFVALNARELPPVSLIGVGLAMNLVAVVVNTGMPYSTPALRASGVARPDGSILVATPQSHPQTEEDSLYVLIDRFAVNAGPIREVLSAGDFVIAAGIGLSICTALLPRRRRPRLVFGKRRRATAFAEYERDVIDLTEFDDDDTDGHGQHRGQLVGAAAGRGSRTATVGISRQVNGHGVSSAEADPADAEVDETYWSQNSADSVAATLLTATLTDSGDRGQPGSNGPRNAWQAVADEIDVARVGDVFWEARESISRRWAPARASIPPPVSNPLQQSVSADGPVGPMLDQESLF